MDLASTPRILRNPPLNLGSSSGSSSGSGRSSSNRARPNIRIYDIAIIPMLLACKAMLDFYHQPYIPFKGCLEAVDRRVGTSAEDQVPTAASTGSRAASGWLRLAEPLSVYGI